MDPFNNDASYEVELFFRVAEEILPYLDCIAFWALSTWFMKEIMLVLLLTIANYENDIAAAPHFLVLKYAVIGIILGFTWALLACVHMPCWEDIKDFIVAAFDYLFLP